jgi:hypothetical protein
MQSKSTFRFLAVGAVASLLAGCGGGLGQALFGSDSSSTAAATAGQSSPSPTPTPPPTTVAETVVVTVGGAGNVTSSPAGINCTGNSGCAQSFPSGSTVTLSATPSPGETFVGWTGACSGSAQSCVITVNSTENVGAQFVPTVQLESLQVTVGGSGTVTSNPAGISCSGTAGNCTQSFDSGTKVTLTASPTSGNTFVGWTGACSGSAGSCTITLTAAASVGASFATTVQTDSLQVTVGGSGTVSSSPAGISCSGGAGCSQSFAGGTQVTLTATPASANTFSGWSGACSGSASTCVVTLSQATQTVGASFAPIVQTDTLQVTVGGSGTVTSSPTGINCSGSSTGCSRSFNAGTTVTLTATAASGNAFSGWTGACSGTANSCTITLTAAQSVGASFTTTVQTDSLQVTVGGSGTVTSSPAGINCSGGSAGCSQSFANGTKVTLSATPGSGNTFSGWTGACSGSAVTCAVTLSSATQSVGATFAAIVQYDSLQVSVGGSGTVTSSPAGINCSGGAAGCSQPFVNGTSVTLTAAPASGYAFSGWSGSCSGSASSCTMTLSAASQSVGASFAATVQYFALQVADGGNGTVTSSPVGINCSGASGSTGCSQSFTSGTVVTLTAAAASGFAFAGWTGACSGSATICSVTMSAAASVGATFTSITPPPTGGTHLMSSSYPATGVQPYKFLVTAPNGPIPAAQQPYEVWPVFAANGNPYFSLDVSATGPFGAWTSAQLQGVGVVAVDPAGWVTSN